MAAAGYNDGTNRIYVSTNSGAAWLASGAPAMLAIGASNQYWISIASSADGTKLVAAVVSGGIYTSTNCGATWSINNAPNPNNWNAVASSADGSRLVAVAGPYFPPGSIYISTNFGNTWTATGAPTTNWYSVASSADGSELLAGTYGGPAFLSTNSGNTWIQQTNLPVARWTTMATSADGKMLMAAASEVGSGFGRIYISTNSGSFWVQANAPTNQSWMAFCSSADGTKMAAIGGVFAYSTNSGNTWMSNNAPKLGVKWGGMASSADGNKLGLAANGSGGIYTSQSTPAPQMNLTLISGNLKFSWLVPSADFVLQQSPDLGSWTDVTNPPVLNPTNLQNEIILSPAGDSGFYRLQTQ